MQEPGEAQFTTAFVVLVVACVLSAPQPLIAQRTGVLPYPPPKTNSNRPYTPPGAEPAGGGTALDRNESAPDSETMMRRRRAKAELAEDFERLRRINKQTMPSLSAASSIDYKEVSRVTCEINSRAKRIKSNSPLMLKEKKGEKRAYEADAARLGSMLPELSRLIDSFLGNPVFYTASVNDEELRSAGGRDIESIIRLSDTINKIAKQLTKSPTARA